ncbi:MAG: OmpA family protein [Alphaproteobacteria bacterium]|jgi:outer membrane protein OmpA-like peptidoglycan-associated protein|nr:OmpA family protein [Alphaproteobacteria bacterium]
MTPNRFPAALTAAILATLLLLAGCGGLPDNAVVLLANADGSVGEVEVANAGKSQVLSKVNEGTELRAKQAPGEVFVAKQEDVDKVFGKAIAASPEPPVRFLIYFESGGAVLTSESEQQLPKILEAIGARPAPEVDISGHADRAGSTELNNKLALERAQAVRERIVAIGVDPARISVSSHGENNPLIPTEDDVAEPRNRRVEVVVK